MVLPAYKTQDSFHFILPHSRDAVGDRFNADTIKKLNDIYGLRRQRHLTMDGSGYNGGTDLGEIMGLSEKPRIETGMERNALDSLHDNDHNAVAQLHFQLDMMAAAGSMVNQMEGAIRSVLTNADRLSDLQKEQFVTLVHNQATLDKVNDGRLKISADIVAKLARETADLLAILAQDNILPHAMRDMTISFLRDTAAQHGLSDIVMRLHDLEHDLSPSLVLAQTVTSIIESLKSLLEQDDLDDATRKDMAEVLKALEQAEDGTPLSRDIIKTLENLSDKTELNIAGLKDANMALKAEQSGLSLAQIKSIEALTDRLDNIRAELGDSHPDLAEQIKNTIDALDARPAAMDSLIKLTQLESRFKTFDKTTLSAALVDMVTTAQEQTKFVAKIQTDTIARKMGLDGKQIVEMVNLYVALDQSEAPKTEAGDKIKQAIAQIDIIDTDMGRLVGLTRLQTILGQSQNAPGDASLTIKALSTSVAQSITGAISTQMTRIVQNLGITTQDVKNIVDVHQTLETASHDLQTSPSLKQQIKHAMDAILRSPVGIGSIAAMQMLQVSKPFADMMANRPSLQGLNDRLGSYVAVNMAKTANVLKAPVATVFKLVDATIAIRTTALPTNMQSAAQRVLKQIETSPLTIATTAAVSKFVDGMKQNAEVKALPIMQKMNDALASQLTHISRQVGLLPSTIKSALAFVHPEKSIRNIAAYGQSLTATPKAIAVELKNIAKSLSSDVTQNTVNKISSVIAAAADADAKIRPAIVAPLAKLADEAKQVPQALKEKLLAIKDIVQQGFTKPQPVPTSPQAGQPSNDPFSNFQTAQQAPSYKQQFAAAKTFDAKVEVATIATVRSIVSVFKGCGSGACGACPVACGSDFAKAAGKATKAAAKVFTAPASFLKKLMPKLS